MNTKPKKNQKESGFGLFVTENIIILMLGIVALVLLLFLAINLYTHHGESYIVPDLRNMTEQEVKAALDGTHLDYEIVDSIYDEKRPLGIVVEQVPKCGNTIKSTRPICLIINAKTVEQTALPDVVEFSWRQAQAMLRSCGLDVGDTLHRAGENKDQVLAVMLNGRKVSVNTKLPVGTKLTLVVCDGTRGDDSNYVPNCIGLSLDESTTTLENVGLHVGNVVYDDASSSGSGSYYVYHQNPAPDAVREGTTVDLFLTKDHDKMDSVNLKPKKEELKPVEQEEDEFF